MERRGRSRPIDDDRYDNEPTQRPIVWLSEQMIDAMRGARRKHDAPSLRRGVEKFLSFALPNLMDPAQST